MYRALLFCAVLLESGCGRIGMDTLDGSVPDARGVDAAPVEEPMIDPPDASPDAAIDASVPDATPDAAVVPSELLMVHLSTTAPFGPAAVSETFAYRPSEDRWVNMDLSPSTHVAHNMVFYGGELLFLGGTDQLEVLDDAARGRGAGDLEALRDVLVDPLIYSEAVVFDGAVWLFGGRVTNEVTGYTDRIYRSRDGVVWEVVGTLPEPLQHHAVAVHAGRLILAGGVRAGNVTTDNTYVSDDGISWQAGGALPRTIGDGNLVSFRGRLLLLGGFGNDRPNAIAVSDDHGATWIDSGTIPEARMMSAAVVYDDEIWLLSGVQDLTAFPVIPRQEVWSSPDGWSWNARASLPIEAVATEAVVATETAALLPW
ncbi:MAG: hypothetical protein AAGF12_32460 [Myxococcota bacterium]